MAATAEEVEMARRWAAGEPLSNILAPAPVETELPVEQVAADLYTPSGGMSVAPETVPGPRVELVEANQSTMPPMSVAPPPAAPQSTPASHEADAREEAIQQSWQREFARRGGTGGAAGLGETPPPGAGTNIPSGAGYPQAFSMPATTPEAPLGLEAPAVRPAPATSAPRPGGGVAGLPGTGAPAPSGGPAGWLTNYMTGGAPTTDPKTGDVTTDPGTTEGTLVRTEPLGTPELVNERGIREEAEKEGFSALVEGQEAAIERGKQLGIKQAEADSADAARLAENAKRQQEQVAALEQQENSARELFDEYEKFKLDKDPHWSSLGIGEQIVQAIAVALGSGGTALTGAPNVAWENIKRKTDAALEVQSKEKEAKLRRAMGEFTLIDAARTRFGDENVAKAVAREAAYRDNVAQIAKWNTVAKTPEQKAALDQMLAAANLELGEAARQRRQAQDLYLISLMKPKGGGPAPRKIKPSLVINVPGYGEVEAYSETDAKEGREATSAYLQGKRDLASARAMLEKGVSRGLGAFGYGTSDYHTADALSTQMIVNLAKAKGGVVTESDIKMSEKEVPDLTRFGQGAAERLDAYERALENRYRSGLQSKARGYNAPSADVRGYTPPPAVRKEGQ